MRTGCRVRATDELLRPLAERLDALPAADREAALARGDEILRQRRAARLMPAPPYPGDERYSRRVDLALTALCGLLVGAGLALAVWGMRYVLSRAIPGL